MEVRSPTVQWLAYLLISTSCILLPSTAPAQSPPLPSDRARIALYEPSGPSADTALTAALRTVTDSVELSLLILGRYDVRRLGAADPEADIADIRAYCQDNRIDQAVLVSGRRNPGGGYTVRLEVYDRPKDGITIDREGSAAGALDLFDATDSLVASLVDGLSGSHILFGSLQVDTDPPGALVAVNGHEVGPSPLRLRGLPAGTLQVSARSPGRETVDSATTIRDGETTTATLKLPRSTGTLQVDVPDDAVVTLSGNGGRATMTGSRQEKMATGTYDLSASSPGLRTISGQVEIRRNDTLRWQPWPEGYLQVGSVPAGAEVSVDGQQRGTSPLLVAVEPGVLHRVELRKSTYELYRADLSAPAARKVPLETELSLKPGSVRVETTPPGAYAWLDGSQQATPCTFTNVVPGEHVVSISDVLVERTFYSAYGDLQVTVKPDEQTTLSQTLRTGTSNLVIQGAPPLAEATLDGIPLDAAVFRPEGASVPAGDGDLAVTAGPQTWRRDIRTQIGGVRRVSVGSLVYSLPRRSIRVDGGLQEWDGIWPVISAARGRDLFPNQAGTQVSRVYLCRDDSYLYGRVDFSDGTPSPALSNDVPYQLDYQFRVILPGNELQLVNVFFNRNGGTGAWVGIYNTATNRGTQSGAPGRFAIGSSTLEFAVSLTSVRRALEGGRHDVQFSVGRTGANGQWNSSETAGLASVDFH